MPGQRKINRWDRRRANKRIKRLKETEKYKKTVKEADKVRIDLPELDEKKRRDLEKDIKAEKNSEE